MAALFSLHPLFSLTTPTPLPPPPSSSFLLPPPSCSFYHNIRRRGRRPLLLRGSSLLLLLLPLPLPLPPFLQHLATPALETSALEHQVEEQEEEEEEEEEQEEQHVIRLFEGATKSVVSIQDIEILNPKAEKGSEAYEDVKLEGTGSGFVWDHQGHIVTNYHVIAKLASDTSQQQRCNVSLLANDGTVSVYEAKLVGVDPSHDLAVLKIDAPEGNLQPLPIGTSRDLRVGQSCYAIGNPYGLEHTLTSGVVSGLGREIPSPIGKPIVGAIQTDASISAGNSGGPLLDSSGRVIGVSTATFTRKGTGVSSGVNFALPIDLVCGIIPNLVVYGKISSQSQFEDLTVKMKEPVPSVSFS